MHKPEELGLTAGSTFYLTEFNNDGLMEADSPLRTACAYMEPTILAHVAAMMRLLRDPYYVRAHKAYSSPTHFVDWITSHLAAIYGDLLTVERTGVPFQKQLSKPCGSGSHPGWFLAATQRSGGFSLNQAKRARPIVLTTLTALARAHHLTGLLPENDAHEYCRNGGAAFSSLYGVPIWQTNEALSLKRLANAGKEHCGTPLMDAGLIAESGADGILRQLLECGIVPGTAFSDHLYKIAGLMWEEDREAFGVSWTGKEHNLFNKWRASYLGTTEAGDRFKIALRGRQ